MTDARTIDIEALLQPIPGENPAGVDLREAGDEQYQDLKDTCKEARSAERRAFETIEDLSEANAALNAVVGEWRRVRDDAQDLLAQRSKDLEVAAMLTESLVRTHGFAGLRDGFDVITDLVSRYWETLYPPAEDDGLRDTVAPIAQLDGGDSEGPLLQHIRKVSLSDASTGSYAFWHQRMAESGSSHFQASEIESALRGSGRQHLETLGANLQATAESAYALDRALTEQCGSDAPSLQRIQDELADIQALLRRTVGERAGLQPAGGDGEPAPAADVPATTEAHPQTGDGGVAVPGQIRTRADALEMLERVAGFFRETEPHSPMSYALDELVRRGRLTFPELLRELMPDDNTRWDFLQRIGISPEQQEGDGWQS